MTRPARLSSADDGAALSAAAVTALFVPGDRPDRFAKAAASGADVVIIDIEDAVAPTAKAQALQSVLQALDPRSADQIRALVRVNGSDTDTHDAEVDALLGLVTPGGSGLLGIVLPKAEDPAVVGALAARLRRADPGLALVPLIESAIGVLAAADIARVPGVTRLAFGAIDLTGDVGADLDSPIVTHAMAALVFASRAGRIESPWDSPSVSIQDGDAVRTAARSARAAGFGGKLCIHPWQLEPVSSAFRPTLAEITWAQSIVDAGDAAVQVDGQMVDRPVIERARRILRRTGPTPS